jgi:hypothetical protein
MSTPQLHVQQAPPPQDFTPASIQVPANIATPQAAMDNVKLQQTNLNAVNTLSGGGRSRSRSRSSKQGTRRRIKHPRHWKPKTFIRMYKGRRYQDTQTGGSAQQSGGIPIPQVGSTCSSGPNCAGAQNAAFTSINNQAMSNGANDAYISQSGGRKVRFSKHHTYHRGSRSSRQSRSKPRHDQSLTTIIAYNIKKVMRKVFS